MLLAATTNSFSPKLCRMDRENTINWFVTQYLTFKNAGMKSKLAYDSIVELGYKSTQKCLYRQISLKKSTGRPMARVNPAGRKPKLNQAQMDQIHAHVVAQNETIKTINRLALRKHILDNHDVSLNMKSIGNYMGKMKIAKRKTTKVTGKSAVPLAVRKAAYWLFVLRMRAKQAWSIPPKQIRSIDTTYTRDPMKIRDTIAPVGSPPQKDGGKRYKYSDAIVTCVSADGVDHTPCIMHTYNPAMAPQATSNGSVAKAKRAHFVALLEQYGIDESRIVYTKSTKHYRGEDPKMYEDFLRHYDIPKDTVIMHDGGGAFKRQKVSIFDTLGYTKHEEYPTIAHQHLSPNDNNLHGCKEVWKMEYPDFTDDPEAGLRLMQLIDIDTAEHSQYYFRRNLLGVAKGHIEGIMRH